MASAKLSLPCFLSLPTCASANTQTRNVLGVSVRPFEVLAEFCAEDEPQTKAVVVPKTANNARNLRIEVSAELAKFRIRLGIQHHA